MKAVIRGLFCALAVAALAGGMTGCDVAPKYQLTGGPINPGGGGTSTDALDPTDPANVQVYFYLDRPVQGLLYSCAIPGHLPRSGTTDQDGGFVCPRTSTVSFYIGTVEAGTFKIGSMELEMFGHEDDTDVRNYVAITPAYLFGTTTTTAYGTGAANSNNDYAMQNIFNLLYSLDVMHLGRQPRILISTAAAALAGPQFLNLNLNQPPASFVADVEPVLGAMDVTNTTYPNKNPDGTVDLMHDGYMLQPSELDALIDLSMRRARTGLYRASPQFSVTSGTTSLIGNLSFLVGATGQVTGFGESRKTSSTGSSTTMLELFYLDHGNEVEADGDLIGGVLGDQVLGLKTENGVAGTTRGFDFFGRLINDRVFGTYTYLSDSASYVVPSYYHKNQVSSTHVGGFHYSENGIEVPSLSSDDGLWLYKVGEQLPDVSVDLLPPEPYSFPRTYLLSFKGYPDGALATSTERTDPDYPVTLTNHQNPDDNPSPEPDGYIQFTMLPNGDIVSDIDGDCSDVVEVGSKYFDNGGIGNEEYLVGKVGNVFQADGPSLTGDSTNVTHSYVTFMLAVYDRRHPQMGLTVGVNPVGQTLDPVVLDATADAQNDPTKTLLLNKACKPTDATCGRPLEWFNDDRFLDEVLKPAFAAGGSTSTVDALYRNPDYYGAITGMVRVCTGT